MEHDQVAGLAAELNAQIRVMERVQERLQSRVALGLDSPAQLDSKLKFGFSCEITITVASGC